MLCSTFKAPGSAVCYSNTAGLAPTRELELGHTPGRSSNLHILPVYVKARKPECCVDCVDGRSAWVGGSAGGADTYTRRPGRLCLVLTLFPTLTPVTPVTSWLGGLVVWWLTRDTPLIRDYHKLNFLSEWTHELSCPQSLPSSYRLPPQPQTLKFPNYQIKKCPFKDSRYNAYMYYVFSGSLSPRSSTTSGL